MALLVAVMAANPVAAAPIVQKTLPDPQEMHVLDQYLAQGPRYWATHPLPTVPAGISVVKPDGALRSDMFVTYLEWRWERNPQAFDERHPHVAAVLNAAAKAGVIDPKALAVPSAATIHPRFLTYADGPGTARPFVVHAEPQLLSSPAPVPEPSSCAVALALAAGAAWWRRRSAR